MSFVLAGLQTGFIILAALFIVLAGLRVRSLPVEYGYFVIANPVGVKQSYNSFNKIASSGKERPPRIVSDRSVAEMPAEYHARTLRKR